MRLKPRSHGFNVRIRSSKLLPELLRRQPLVILGRRFVLLLVQEVFERGFLLRAACQDQLHPRHRQIGRSSAGVELGPGERMSIMPQCL